ncbi:type II secretion system protein, partial [bacterium]|nr:type II secretion system protein [bacterium]
MTKLKTAFTLAEGATHRGKSYTPPLKKLPSLAREGLRVGLFPARSKHTTTETISLPYETLPSKQSSELFARGFSFRELCSSNRKRLGWVPSRKGKRAAFTLAEVLVTLAIIGVVAAMTLPTIMVNINSKVDGNQKKVTEAKLVQGLNMLDLHG